MQTLRTSERDHLQPRIPGEPGLWAMIFGDLVIFGLLFITYAVYRSAAVPLYHEAATALNRTLGLTNTLVLLTSSAIMAWAVRRWRQEDHDKGFLAFAFGCSAALGLTFIAIKALEWRHLIHAGATVESSEYFMFYYMLTGVHLLHVVIGTTILCILAATTRLSSPGKSAAFVEAAGVFWHLVDILWLFLFGLLYLL